MGAKENKALWLVKNQRRDMFQCNESWLNLTDWKKWSLSVRQYLSGQERRGKCRKWACELCFLIYLSKARSVVKG